MKLIVEDDYRGMSQKAAVDAADFINKNPGALLCFAAGDTPLGMFEELIKMQEAKVVDLTSVYYAGLDEWLGLGYGDKGSCVQVMADAYYTPAGIPKERIQLFDGLEPDTAAQCRKMETWIELRGGIGLAVLGVGLNGHIGFNEPGSPGAKGCFTIALDGITKAAGAKYFGKPAAAEQGITIGRSTLRDSKKLIILASGENKADIIKASLTGTMEPKVPASLLRDHPDLTVIVDKAAASKL